MMVLLMIISSHLWSQTYSIEKWYEGNPSATVLTFDDWSPGHGSIAVPELINRGLTGTFFITTGNSFAGGGYTQMNYGAANGLEMANHTITHPELAKVDAATLINETDGAKSIIENNVPNQGDVLTFCYPKGSYNQAVIDQVKKNHIAARQFEENQVHTFPYEFAASEDDYFRIKQIQVNNTLMDATKMGSWIDHGITNNGLIVFTFHSIGPADTWFDQISTAFFTELLDVVNHKKNQTWVTTFADAVKYHKEAHCATLSTVSTSSDQWILALTDTLSNNAIYNHPLSLRLTIPTGEFVTSITQNGTVLPFTMNGNEAIFNAIPDAGHITINKNGSGIIVSVNITSPADNSTFTALTPLTISATASAIGGTVSDVTFTVDGQTFTDNTAPYSANWTPSALGSYTITATAHTVEGESSQTTTQVTYEAPPVCQYPDYISSQVYNSGDRVNYNNQEWKAKWWTQNVAPPAQQWELLGECGGGSSNESPIVSVTSPSNNFTVDEGTTISITANASDIDGTITKVEFFQGNTKLGEDVTFPYAFNWTNAAVGTYAITAIATDNEGASTTSSIVSIIVNSTSSNDSPSVSLTSPVHNSSVDEGTAISITANASDTDGTITKVEFFQGSTKLGEDLTAPYSYNWTNAAVGTYAITAMATDNEGASTISSIVSITVNSVGGGTCSAPVWNSSTAYNGGTIVSYNGHEYKANWWIQGQNPASHSGPTGSGQPWTDLGACANAKQSSTNTIQSMGSIYPNPFENQLTVSNDGIYSLEIYSIDGQLILQGNYSSPVTIATDEWHSGIYFVKVTQNEVVTSSRIVKP